MLTVILSQNTWIQKKSIYDLVIAYWSKNKVAQLKLDFIYLHTNKLFLYWTMIQYISTYNHTYRIYFYRIFWKIIQIKWNSILIQNFLCIAIEVIFHLIKFQLKQSFSIPLFDLWVMIRILTCLLQGHFSLWPLGPSILF